MQLTSVFVTMMIIAVAWHITATILIYRYLQKKNLKVSFVFLRVLILKYVAQYREITLQESGKVGPLFSHWIVSINLALISVILFALTR